MKNFPDLPPLWTLGAFALSWGIAYLVPIGAIQSYGLRLLGLAWIGLAVAVVLWAAVYFRKKKTTIEPHHTPSALITTGPYRFSRNPIYLAMVMASAGWAVWCGSVLAVIPVVGLAWVLHRRFVMPEEAVLAQEFGEQATAYIAKTKRWV